MLASNSVLRACLVVPTSFAVRRLLCSGPWCIRPPVTFVYVSGCYPPLLSFPFTGAPHRAACFLSVWFFIPSCHLACGLSAAHLLRFRNNGRVALLISTIAPLLPPTRYALSLQTETAGDVPEAGSCRVPRKHGHLQVVRPLRPFHRMLSCFGVLITQLIMFFRSYLLIMLWCTLLIMFWWLIYQLLFGWSLVIYSPVRCVLSSKLPYYSSASSCCGVVP